MPCPRQTYTSRILAGISDIGGVYSMAHLNIAAIVPWVERHTDSGRNSVPGEGVSLL